ncbi:radical SAM protein [Brachyspira hyodysenteriae]|uniref:Fe-S oxidoreductase containing radical SAM domain n=1 Tax=Brachyspira hyodysenteriae (strain ATCC 49526 / WA1) TaxID=565034 RepID=A0A3B6VBA5_BRAHW|nr:radical SAM protein [Brachyspira hyodysenteriae]ACN85129.1 Fe-S oxidoreductase containing radical SAM domain [Brachyspira hyodysenteriae WA1]KLI25395.1 radical SAM protein [Brachyspira hyodysenteriae]KLI27816.1 radical SAM protein [Brachyspira hyodysenteriae]KLI42410.1 radical SAM protein [Brachyspira hyodysenteriae]KLI46173.1 radical SAM protein [Brachyspira hyodysenteriae]
MKAKIKPRIDLENRTKLETVIPLETPFIIFIDPSDKCNFKCKFCPTGNIELMQNTSGRNFGSMDFNLYKKIIDDLQQFEGKVKVIRLYKDGEPLLNKHFAEMVEYAKKSDKVNRVDTTTNASLLNKDLSLQIINAGLDRINISIEGMNSQQYLDFSKANVNFEKLVENITFFYENRKQCEMIVKINGDIISEEQKQEFYNIFGEIADGVNIESVMSCWPEFELDGISVNMERGIYGQEIKEVMVCPYVFYSMSINSTGIASACYLDWERKLIIGDVNKESVKTIWNSNEMNNLRKLFLKKERKSHPICKNCGQLTHGMPDNIDDYADELLNKISIL